MQYKGYFTNESISLGQLTHVAKYEMMQMYGLTRVNELWTVAKIVH